MNTDSKALAELQPRVDKWLMACFGEVIARDKTERNHRFLEESLELVQSLGCTKSEAHQLVDYVYGREVGESYQECGGVMITLAALCLANDLDMGICAEKELARIWTKVEKIRAKQAAKPKHSPLPQLAATNNNPSQSDAVEFAEDNYKKAKEWVEEENPYHMFSTGHVEWHNGAMHAILNYNTKPKEKEV